MHHPGRLVAALAFVLAGGCVKLDSFQCAQSSECQNGDLLGSCEPGGMCSFPDPACPSGKKYGDLAGAQSGLCVDDMGGTDGTTAPPTPTTSTTGTTLDITSTLDLSSTSQDPSSTSATSGLTTTSTTSTDDTTVGPTCGEIGEACVDGACCGACATCNAEDTCVPLGADEGAQVCGVCSFCGGDGECAASPPDTECFDDCGDYVWGELVDGLKSACYAYAPLQVTSTCDGEGACAPIDPGEVCPDPSMRPDLMVKLAECDEVCLENEGFCAPGEPASAVDLDSYCLLDGENETCHSTCSADQTGLDVVRCEQGVCTPGATESCGAYFCDEVLNVCPDLCEFASQCVSGACVDMMCM